MPSEEYDPAYGHIPPAALSQVVAPWLWYVPNLFPGYAIQQSTFLTYPAATNDVEAHLYFGLLPALIVLFGLIAPLWGGQKLPPRLVGWAIFGLLAAIYATGWLLPIARHLPGFGFFRGPGRYGIVTTLGGGADRRLGRGRRMASRRRAGLAEAGSDRAVCRDDRGPVAGEPAGDVCDDRPGAADRLPPEKRPGPRTVSRAGASAGLCSRSEHADADRDRRGAGVPGAGALGVLWRAADIFGRGP